MSTVRSRAELDVIFAPGQPNFSISEQDQLDLVATIDAKTELSVQEAGYAGGVDPSYSASQNRAGLDAATAAAIAQKKRLVLPGGDINYDGPWNVVASNWDCRGGPGNTTRMINAQAATQDHYKVGPGAGGSGVGLTGETKDIFFDGVTGVPNSSGKAAVKLDGMRHYRITNVRMGGQDIGLDCVNNCFAMRADNIRAWYGGLNVAVNIRPGTVSGSDHLYINPWITGNKAAVHVGGDGGGYRFLGGQYAAGFNLVADDDALGVFVLGKDYLTQAAADVEAITLVGPSFEGLKYLWAFRCFAAVGLQLDDVSLNPPVKATPASGVFKSTAMTTSRVLWNRGTIQGHWLDPLLVNISGFGSAWHWEERGGWKSKTPASRNGVDESGGSTTWMKALCAMGGVGRGIATFSTGSRNVTYYGGAVPLWVSSNPATGAYEKSADGSSWVGV